MRRSRSAGVNPKARPVTSRCSQMPRSGWAFAARTDAQPLRLRSRTTSASAAVGGTSVLVVREVVLGSSASLYVACSLDLTRIVTAEMPGQGQAGSQNAPTGFKEAVACVVAYLWRWRWCSRFLRLPAAGPPAQSNPCPHQGRRQRRQLPPPSPPPLRHSRSRAPRRAFPSQPPQWPPLPVGSRFQSAAPLRPTRTPTSRGRGAAKVTLPRTTPRSGRCRPHPDA
ncbi:hypothetical protein FHW15_001801 [Terracoccus luteus]|uniref:Uncharacterized protein n=1 Tax=Terracoccus luteus TaxID=53356 RepID=A0A839PVU9_9MICO|nr:hypothetical protein [Terracoccus luteus]MCP2172304.1 hypothetical protein [Terracoccus luteus]